VKSRRLFLVIHYFQGVEALGGNPHDGDTKLRRQMKEMPTDDPLSARVHRADGRKSPGYLFEVKSHRIEYPWDYYNLVATSRPGSLIPSTKSAMPVLKKSESRITSDRQCR